MSHARQQIREAVAGLLKTTPQAWSQVFETRIPKTRPTRDYLMVFSDGEASAKDTVDLDSDYERRCNLVIVGHLRLPGNADTETVEDRMDAVASEIETKLTFDDLLGATDMDKLKGLELASTEMVVVVNEQDQPDHAEVTLTYVVDYYTAEGSPGTLT